MKSVASILRARLAGVAGLVATPLSPSHYVGLLRPLSSPSRQARVEAIAQETRDVTTLTLRPGSQTVQLAEDLRKQGVDVEQLVFPDEVHDFLLHRNWLAAYTASFDFLSRKLVKRTRSVKVTLQ